MARQAVVQSAQTPHSKNTSCALLHCVLLHDFFFPEPGIFLPVIVAYQSSTLPSRSSENASNIPKFFSTSSLFKMVAPSCVRTLRPVYSVAVWQEGSRAKG